MAPSLIRISFPVLLLAYFQLSRLVVVVSAGSARRRLAPNESIHRYLSEENEAGNMQPKLTVTAMKVDDADDDDDYEIDLVQATAAVNSKTTYSIGHLGAKLPIGDLGVKYLVQDRTPLVEDEGMAQMSSLLVEDEGMAHIRNIGAKPTPKQTPTTFAFISVDEDTETVNGIAKKEKGKAMNIQQLTGSTVFAALADDFVPPKDFSCQVSDKRGGGRRIMDDEGLVDEYDPDDHHDHEHEHGHHHEHNHDHDHVFSGDDIDHLINDLTPDHPRKQHKQRRTAGFQSAPSFQVDLYIEIDRQFIAKNSNNLTLAFNYVNTIVTAASSIFEAEVDTRLFVGHIAVTDLYETAPDSKSALNIMKEVYGNATQWHYTDGNGVDLHHAILGQKMNGGIATIGTVCSSQYGFGISPSVRGNFLSLDFATVWDMSVFAHEIGHNFGAFHTYDRRGFKPPVDRCFIRSRDASTCPAQTQLEGAATLMSYCDACPGANVASNAYTFGGNFIGNDPSDINEWRNNPSLVGSFNNEPKRVPKTMYDHVSSRTCTQPHFLCEKDSDCFDSRQCTIDTCNIDTGQCEHKMRPDCCGNGICEANEQPCAYGVECMQNQRTCSDDCGPYDLETRSCNKCNPRKGRGNGIMFDIHSLSSDIVTINTMEFRHTETELSTVTIYTADNSYANIATTPEEWIVANTTDIKIGGKKGGYATIQFEIPIAVTPNSVRTFYIASTGKLISGDHEEGVDDTAIDNTLSIKNQARIVGSPFGGGLKGTWDGKVNYSIFVLPSLFT